MGACTLIPPFVYIHNMKIEKKIISVVECKTYNVILRRFDNFFPRRRSFYISHETSDSFVPPRRGGAKICESHRGHRTRTRPDRRGMNRPRAIRTGWRARLVVLHGHVESTWPHDERVSWTPRRTGRKSVVIFFFFFCRQKSPEPVLERRAPRGRNPPCLSVIGSREIIIFGVCFNIIFFSPTDDHRYVIVDYNQNVIVELRDYYFTPETNGRRSNVTVCTTALSLPGHVRRAFGRAVSRSNGYRIIL